MQDEPIVCVHQVRLWDAFQKFQLHFKRCLAFGQADAVADSKNVCINCHGGLMERHIENHIGCFATDPWERFKKFPRPWNFALMLLNQDFACLHQMFGLALIKANGFDVRL